MCIEDYIPFGKENAVTRAELEFLTGLNDRTIRNLIATARKKTLILNLQNGNGYYRPTADERTDVERFVRQEKKRASNIFRNLKSANEYLAQIDGQIDFTNIPK